MAGGRRKQRYAASNLDPSWNLQEDNQGDEGPIPASTATERPEQVIGAEFTTISSQPSQIVSSDALSSPHATQVQDQQPQFHSQRLSRLEVFELPITRGSTPSRDSRDGDESASTIGSSAPSRSTKTKKKRYALEHSADWLEEDYAIGPDLRPSPTYPPQPLPAMPHQPQQMQQMQPSPSIAAQPQALTTPSSMATTSPALSIFRGGGHQTYSPGQDAPAIQPGAPSTYSPSSTFTGVAQQQQQQPEGEQHNHPTLNNHLGAIAEEHPIPPAMPAPPQPQPQPLPLPAHTKRNRWSSLLRRG